MGFLTRCKRPFLFAFLLQFCNMLFSFFLKTFLILFEKQQPPKGVDTLFQESHSMHSPDLEDDIGELIDQVERSDRLSRLRSLTEQQYRVVELYTEGYATSDIAQILSLDNQTVLNHKNRAVQKYKSIIPKVSKG